MGRKYCYPKITQDENGKYYFEDYKGATSKKFIVATKYQEGFSLVREKSIYEREQYRDLVGNITPQKTELGRDFYRFCKGEITLFQLPAKHFACYPFYQAVLDAIWTRLETAKASGKLTQTEANRKFMKALQACTDKRTASKSLAKKNKALKELF